MTKQTFANTNSHSAWLAKAGFGLALHWTAESLPRGGDRPLPFAQAVERFDVSRLAQQCTDSGAGWLLFTISHAWQHLPFPSETLERVLPGRTCERDLMGEITAALAVVNIPIIFYYPNVAGDTDPDWQRASGWLYDPKSYADLVAEIGERYGHRLAGWWLDNCYDPKLHYPPWHHLAPSVDGHAGLYDFKRYAQMLRIGNANRILTFNFSGTSAWQSALGDGIVDYAAGESNHLDRVPASSLSGEGGSQWHSFVWMDEFWVHTTPGDVPPPRYETGDVVDYIRYVIRHGGAFSYGAAPYQDELVADATMDQLRAIKKALHG